MTSKKVHGQQMRIEILILGFKDLNELVPFLS